MRLPPVFDTLPVRVASWDLPQENDVESQGGLRTPSASSEPAIPLPRRQTGVIYRDGKPVEDRPQDVERPARERAIIPSPLPPRPAPRVTLPLASSVPPGAVQVDKRNGLVSIVVRDAPLNEILGLLAQQQGLNIIAAEDVTANVSVTLHQVPFEQALTHVLSVAGYMWVRQDNILIVTSIAAGNKFSPYSQGREVRVLPLDYVAASDIDQVIKGLLSPAGQSFITQSTDQDNRKTQELVVVEDVPAYLARIEQYIGQVDVPPRQVLIQVHVMSIELSDDLKHGINFQYLDTIGAPSITLGTQGLADAAAFSKGAAPAFFFTVAASDLTTLVELIETTTDAKTLATPKVLALNGQQARIQIGQQLGFRVTTTTQTSTLESVDFLDVGVVLTVTPRITQDNNVVMLVKPEVSSGQIHPKTELPEEETTEVETAVMLPDGHGMLIGGLIQEEDVETQNKIPLLGDVWLLGRLFQNRHVTRKRTEIIIALIPHIVPYKPGREQHECEQYRRATTPLLYGPLLQNPRPYEPRFPDAGQKLPYHNKLQHFCPPPDDGCWTPQAGLGDPCTGGIGPAGPLPCEGAPIREVPSAPTEVTVPGALEPIPSPEPIR